MAKVTVGDLVKDTITGYEGIVIGRTEYLFGCVRALVQARHLDGARTKGGKPHEGLWFDEPQLEVLKAGVVAKPSESVPPPASRVTGGPRTPPPARSRPTR